MSSPAPLLPSKTTLRLWNLAVLYAGMVMTMVGVYHEFEGGFFRLDTAMSHPGTTGPMGHRVLFIGVAWLFKLAIPGLTTLRAYKLSQLVATVFTFLVMRAWLRYFVSREWEWLGHLLLGAMFVCVLNYYNFHDIAVVGFYAACLALLLRRRYIPYLLVYSIGLWNHENLSMVTGVAFVYLWLERERKQALILGGVQGAIFVLYRLAVTHFIPGDDLTPTGLQLNLHPYASFGRGLVLENLLLVFPVAAAVLAYRYAPRFLKIALLAHFAALFVGTMLYGKLDEARQWNTMFAIIVPMAVILVERIVRGISAAPRDAMGERDVGSKSLASVR